MRKLNKLIKKTHFFTVDINDHRSCYQGVSEYIPEEDIEEISDEVFTKMIEKDTCIRLQVYPDTPIGFYVIYHYDFEKAIDQALKQ